MSAHGPMLVCSPWSCDGVCMNRLNDKEVISVKSCENAVALIQDYKPPPLPTGVRKTYISHVGLHNNRKVGISSTDLLFPASRQLTLTRQLDSNTGICVQSDCVYRCTIRIQPVLAVKYLKFYFKHAAGDSEDTHV